MANPIRTDIERIIDAPETRNVLEYKQIKKLANSVTPSVLNLEFFTCSGAVVSITDFLDGQNGQSIHIRGDGNTTIVNGTPIKTNTGANKLLAANKVYTFTFFSGTWIENE